MMITCDYRVGSVSLFNENFVIFWQPHFFKDKDNFRMLLYMSGCTVRCGDGTMKLLKALKKN